MKVASDKQWVSIIPHRQVCEVLGLTNYRHVAQCAAQFCLGGVMVPALIRQRSARLYVFPDSSKLSFTRTTTCDEDRPVLPRGPGHSGNKVHGPVACCML